jgi:hypothetical protein
LERVNWKRDIIANSRHLIIDLLYDNPPRTQPIPSPAHFPLCFQVFLRTLEDFSCVHLFIRLDYTFRL